MSKGIQKKVLIKNKKASYNYEFLDTFTAGLVLKGSEIKSIRLQQVSLNEAYCYLASNEVFIKGMHIGVYEQAAHYGHEPTRNRKLLLNKKEIEKIDKALKDKGITLIPVRLYITDRGFAKIDIALGKGKKLHDKRDSLKEKDSKRAIARAQL